MNAFIPHSELSDMEHRSFWPTRVADLAQSELLLLGAYRHWLTGLNQDAPKHFEIVSREFRLALGEVDGRTALTAFAVMVRVLARGQRRTMHFHMPCCGVLGLDERQIICMAAACQKKRFLLARRIAEWIVEEVQAGDLLGRVSMLASLMMHHGLTMPERATLHQPPEEKMTYIDRVH